MKRTPGERRQITKQVLENAIRDGITRGEFGLGELENEKPVCKYFGGDAYPSISFDPGEIIIQAQICKQQEKLEEKQNFLCDKCEYTTKSIEEFEEHKKIHVTTEITKEITNLNYSFSVPEGTINYTSGMFLHIAEKFKQFRLTISARDGKMTKQDIENLKETLRQMGADSDLFDQYNESK